MAFSEDQIKELEAPLDASHVATRAKGGTQLSYLEGWHVIAEANRIFGYDAWTRETYDLTEVHDPYQNEKGNWVVSYRARSQISVGEIVRHGCGFGSGFSKQIGEAHESAIKEAETDAMKRALMTFGNPFGLALYDKTKRNVTKGPRKPDDVATQRQATRQQQDVHKWQGPLKVTEIKDDLNALSEKLAAAENEDEVTVVLDEYAQVLSQTKVDLPSWHAAATKAINEKLNGFLEGAA